MKTLKHLAAKRGLARKLNSELRLINFRLKNKTQKTYDSLDDYKSAMGARQKGGK